MRFKKILVASHDTPGARAAEQLAYQLCESGGIFSHLYVVPDFWKGMLGDDWLNNAVTQDRFGKYVESQLSSEIDKARQRLTQEVEGHGLHYYFDFRVGNPAEQLLEVAYAHTPDIVVIGAPRPKGTSGLRSRMDLDTLVRNLSMPLIVAPLSSQ